MSQKNYIPLLDRLQGKKTNKKTLETIYQDIRLNLQSLLNSRTKLYPFNQKNIELKESLLNYGLDDYSNEAVITPATQQCFLKEINNKISIFEKRLKNINVYLNEDHLQTNQNCIAIIIKADLNLKSNFETVIYEAIVTNTDISIRNQEQ